MRGWWFVLMMACDREGGGLDAAEACDALEHAGEDCGTATETAAPPPSTSRVADHGTTTESSGGSCEEALAECTHDDLRLILDYADCVDANCTSPAECVDILFQVSQPCLGISSGRDTG
jgi:hypothetical protein